MVLPPDNGSLYARLREADTVAALPCARRAARRASEDPLLESADVGFASTPVPVCYVPRFRARATMM